VGGEVSPDFLHYLLVSDGFLEGYRRHGEDTQEGNELQLPFTKP